MTRHVLHSGAAGGGRGRRQGTRLCKRSTCAHRVRMIWRTHIAAFAKQGLPSPSLPWLQPRPRPRHWHWPGQDQDSGRFWEAHRPTVEGERRCTQCFGARRAWPANKDHSGHSVGIRAGQTLTQFSVAALCCSLMPESLPLCPGRALQGDQLPTNRSACRWWCLQMMPESLPLCPGRALQGDLLPTNLGQTLSRKDCLQCCCSTAPTLAPKSSMHRCGWALRGALARVLSRTWGR